MRLHLCIYCQIAKLVPNTFWVVALHFSWAVCCHQAIQLTGKPYCCRMKQSESKLWQFSSRLNDVCLRMNRGTCKHGHHPTLPVSSGDRWTAKDRESRSELWCPDAASVEAAGRWAVIYLSACVRRRQASSTDSEAAWLSGRLWAHIYLAMTLSIKRCRWEGMVGVLRNFSRESSLCCLTLFYKRDLATWQNFSRLLVHLDVKWITFPNL